MVTFELVSENEIDNKLVSFQNTILESEIEYNEIYQEAMLTEASILMESSISQPTFIENIIRFLGKLIKWFIDASKKIYRFINDILTKVSGNMGVIRKALRRVKNEAISHLPIVIKSQFPQLQSISQFDKLHKEFISSFKNVDKVTKSRGRNGRYGGDVMDSLREYKKYLDGLTVSYVEDINVDVKDVDGIVKNADSIIIDSKTQATRAIAMCNDGIKMAKTNIETLKRKEDPDLEEISDERDKIVAYRAIIGELTYLNTRTIRIVSSQSNKISRMKIRMGIEARKRK